MRVFREFEKPRWHPDELNIEPGPSVHLDLHRVVAFQDWGETDASGSPVVHVELDSAGIKSHLVKSSIQGMQEIMEEFKEGARDA